MTARMVVVQGDITGQEVDAIVNAANERLRGGGGVDGAIHRAAGPRAAGGMHRRSAAARPARRGSPRAIELPARHVIHTVGPVWQGGGQGEPALLAACYRNSLELAVANGVRTIAFPGISTGRLRLPARGGDPARDDHGQGLPGDDAGDRAGPLRDLRRSGDRGRRAGPGRARPALISGRRCARAAARAPASSASLSAGAAPQLGRRRLAPARPAARRRAALRGLLVLHRAALDPLEPRAVELAGLVEQRVGDRADMRVDALEVAQDVEVRARSNRCSPAARRAAAPGGSRPPGARRRGPRPSRRSACAAIATSPDMKTPSAIRRLSSTWACSASISAQPSLEKRSCRRIFFSASSSRLLSMMSPMCSRLVVNARISAERRLSPGIERLAADVGDEQLDRLVQLVDRVSPCAAARRASAGRCERNTSKESRSMVSIRSPMRSASRAAQASARLGLSRVVRSRWRGCSGSTSTGRSGRRRAHSLATTSVSRMKREAERQVEGGVEVDHDAAGRRLPAAAARARPWRRTAAATDAAGQAEDQIAERDPARRGLVGEGRGDRRHGGAEIGAEHQRAGAGQRQHADARERHDQQHDRQAGMGEPGQQRGDQDQDQRLAGERAEQLLQDRRFAHRRRGEQDQPQRQQHQPEPDRDPAEPVVARPLGAVVGDHADQDQDRRQPVEVERQHLGDQRAAEVGAEHDRERRRGRRPRRGRRRTATTSAVAVLLCRIPVTPRPARNAAKRLRSETRSRWRRSAPNTRMIPVRTMRVPHSRSATAPSSWIRIVGRGRRVTSGHRCGAHGAAPAVAGACRLAQRVGGCRRPVLVRLLRSRSRSGSRGPRQ